MPRTFRLAVIADVHADAHALREALDRIRDMECDQVVCAGDLVDYGVFPEETIAIFRETMIPCVCGNHDRWVLSEGRDISGWDLTDRAINYLETLPRQWSTKIAGVRVAVYHARPGSDTDGIYADNCMRRSDLEALLDRADADILVLAHTHWPMEITVSGRGKIVNPGAVLRDPAVPLEEDIKLLDLATGKWSPAPKPEGGTFAVLELPSMKFSVYRAVDGAEIEIDRRSIGWLLPTPRSRR